MQESFLYLKDFDLAARRVHMLQVFSMLVLCESVYLNPEGNAFLATMFPGCKLTANTVNLESKYGQY